MPETINDDGVPLYRAKRDRLNEILDDMNAPRGFYYALSELVHRLDREHPLFNEAIKLIKEIIPEGLNKKLENDELRRIDSCLIVH